MNKTELIGSVAESAGLSKTQAEQAVNSVMSSIEGELKSGGKVSLVGFGTFGINDRKARDGRNPQTGAKIKIPARKVVTFKAGKTLAESVN